MGCAIPRAELIDTLKSYGKKRYLVNKARTWGINSVGYKDENSRSDEFAERVVIGAPAVREKRRDERLLASCECVIDMAAAFFSISGKELRSAGRGHGDAGRVRQIAMYAANSELGLSATEIGRAFGRSHSTVLHACQLVEQLRDDAEFDAIVHRFELIVRAAFRGFEVH
jgi:Bacterial dnaA protein helix-turn-helix